MTERIQITGVEILDRKVIHGGVTLKQGEGEDVGRVVCSANVENRSLWGGSIFVYDLGRLYEAPQGCTIDCQPHIFATLRGVAVSPTLCRIIHGNGGVTSGIILVGQSNGFQDRGLDEDMPFAYITKRPSIER